MKVSKLNHGLSTAIEMSSYFIFRLVERSLPPFDAFLELRESSAAGGCSRF